jgi:hypothetical protein
MRYSVAINSSKILESNSPHSPLSSGREGWRPKGDGVSYYEFNNKFD